MSAAAKVLDPCFRVVEPEGILIFSETKPRCWSANCWP